MIISVFDTTIGSYNLGNDIIMDSVYTELSQLFPNSQYYKLAPMDIGFHTRGCIAKSDLVFFGGTNSLNANMLKYKQWDLKLRNTFGVRNVILLGLGWWQYENTPVSPYTKYLLRKALSKNYLHSVRDNYTLEKLKSIGINSINTGCPTLWRITNDTIEGIPAERQKCVVFTLTDYNQNEVRDSLLIKTCLENYDELICFPQGMGDINYVEKLGFKNYVTFLRPRLDDFRRKLESGGIDYIGTRLHAGILALQHSCHAIIIGIDNRAAEMRKDFGLPVVDSVEIGSLNNLIQDRIPINIKVPLSEIEKWKGQFARFLDL